jgi:GAF domain-containing protein
VLGRGDLVHGHTRNLPESERPELQAEEILSIVVVPIFVEGEWWGFVGFDECLAEREWFVAEMDALKAAASTLGAALRRRRGEEALRESEERYSLVVEGRTTASSIGTSVPANSIGTTGSTRCLAYHTPRSLLSSTCSLNGSTPRTANGF